MVGDVLVSRGILAYGSVCMCVYTQNQKFLQGSVAITVFLLLWLYMYVYM